MFCEGDLTASRTKFPRPSSVTIKSDGPEPIYSDGVKSGSRQYEYYFGGELTASDLTLDAVMIQNLYIVFIHCVQL